MFKHVNSENEIYQSMGQKLSSVQLENKHDFDKLIRVVDYLNTASKIFDTAGMYKEAREINSILFSFASINKINNQLIKIINEAGIAKEDAINIVKNYDANRIEGIYHKIKEGESIPSIAFYILQKTAEELKDNEGDFDEGPANRIEKLNKAARSIRNKYKVY